MAAVLRSMGGSKEFIQEGMKTHWEQSQKHSRTVCRYLDVHRCRGNNLNRYLCAGVRLDRRKLRPRGSCREDEKRECTC